MNRFVLAVCGGPAGPAFEIVCNTREAAAAARERMKEADLALFVQNGQAA